MFVMYMSRIFDFFIKIVAFNQNQAAGFNLTMNDVRFALHHSVDSNFLGY